MAASLIVIAFETEDEAEKLREGLKSQQHSGIVGINDIAVVSKDADGKVKVHNQVSHGTMVGTGAGALLGVLLATVFFPVGAILLGAAGGALVGRLADTGVVPFNPDQIARPWRGIVTDRYTYARFEQEPWVLFDRQRDPAEMQNLVGDVSHADLQRELDQRLAALMKRHGDDWKFNSSELIEEGGRLYRHATFYTLDEYRAWAKANPDKSK